MLVCMISYEIMLNFNLKIKITSECLNKVLFNLQCCQFVKCCGSYDFIMQNFIMLNFRSHQRGGSVFGTAHPGKIWGHVYCNKKKSCKTSTPTEGPIPWVLRHKPCSWATFCFALFKDLHSLSARSCQFSHWVSSEPLFLLWLLYLSQFRNSGYAKIRHTLHSAANTTFHTIIIVVEAYLWPYQ